MNKISIVTTSLNHVAFLGEALESVRSQGYEDVEHLVLDGESNDGTVDLLRSRSGPEWKHLYWISERDGGQAEAMNKGFHLATGDIIGWLNSDDRYRPGCLQKIADVFDQNPDIDVLYGDYALIDENGARLRVRREIKFNRFVLFYHRVLYIPTTSCFFRRRIFDEGNLLNESLHYAMDHEFYMRLANRSYRFRHIHALLADFRLHPASKTCATGARQLAESRATMQKHSPVGTGIDNETLRTLCLGACQVTAALARYTEKFLRGYYLPDSIVGREPKYLRNQNR